MRLLPSSNSCASSDCSAVRIRANKYCVSSPTCHEMQPRCSRDAAEMLALRAAPDLEQQLARLERAAHVREIDA